MISIENRRAPVYKTKNKSNEAGSNIDGDENVRRRLDRSLNGPGELWPCRPDELAAVHEVVELCWWSLYDLKHK